MKKKIVGAQFSRQLPNGSHDFQHIFYDFIKDPKTTIALTFLKNNIPDISGVYIFNFFDSLANLLAFELLYLV